MSDKRRDFLEFAASRRPELRSEYALCGGWRTADDIAQIALTRLYWA